MPSKRRKMGKRKRKKKGKKKEKIIPDPPPLHTLTDLYNQLMEKVGHLEEMRVMARQKRLEGWFMTREMSRLKSDNQIYHDYLDDNINELHEIITKIMDYIEKERSSIQKEIDRLLAQLNRRHANIRKRTEELEEQLAQVKMDLLEFEPLIAKLAKMLARLGQLAKDIAAAELEADIKTRNLKNQFLYERAKLHNHLEKQLFDLIQNCRSYIMPILWHHMRRTQFSNGCARWRLAKADAKNIRFGEQRDELMLKRKLLTLETNYLGVDWAILKLSEVQMQRRKQMKEESRKVKTFPEEPPTELALAFNIYLKKRLTAFHEAKKRHAKAKKLELEQEASKPRTDSGRQEDDLEEVEEEDAENDAEEWEDLDTEMEDEDWQSYPPLKRHRYRKPKYTSADDNDETDVEGDSSSDDAENGGSTGSSYSSNEDYTKDPAEDSRKVVVTKISKASMASIHTKVN